MITIDPAWQGDVKFYELIYGSWLTYIFTIVLFEKVLRAPLEEWRYVMLTFLGAFAFWVNHYFQNASFYMILLNLYSLCFLIAWYFVAVKHQPKGTVWKIAATLCAVIFTLAFIGFEYIARIGVEAGIYEFWFMLGAAFGIVGIIIWRGPVQDVWNGTGK